MSWVLLFLLWSLLLLLLLLGFHDRVVDLWLPATSTDGWSWLSFFSFFVTKYFFFVLLFIQRFGRGEEVPSEAEIALEEAKLQQTYEKAMIDAMGYVPETEDGGKDYKGRCGEKEGAP